MIVAGRDSGAMPGLDEILHDVDPDDEHALSAAAEAVDAAALPIQSTMGFRDSLRDLVYSVRNRRLVETLPQEVVSYPWFECHVPHAGTARVVIESHESADAAVDLKVFGSGWGRGRRLTLGITDESEARDTCVSYLIELAVAPKLYEDAGGRSIVLDLVRLAGTRAAVADPCEHCALAPGALDPLDTELDPFIDLRADRVTRTHTVELDWSQEERFEIGVTVPHAPVGLSLSVQAATSSRWEVTYELPPGYLHQPYRPLDANLFLPPRWAFE